MTGPSFVVLVVCVAALVTWACSRPVSQRARRRMWRRRVRYLMRHPEKIGFPAVRQLLSVGGVEPESVNHVVRRARAKRIAPLLLWAFGLRHGAQMLALAVSAGLDGRELADHIYDLERLDLESLRLLAEFDGSPTSISGPRRFRAA